MDSTIAQGVLERLDAVTAKMGVAADHLWGLWLATWWRPLLTPAFAMVVGMIGLLIAWRLWKVYLGTGDTDDSRDDGWAVAAVILGTCSGLCAIVATGLLVGVLPYAFNHELYAVDRLRALVGK